MKKTNKKAKIITVIAIVTVIIIAAILITTNVIKKNNVNNESYLATANANSDLVASYIKSGVTIGGITGTLETIDVSNATATAEGVLEGETFYAGNSEIKTGTMTNNGGWSTNINGSESISIPKGYHDGTGTVTGSGTKKGTLLASYITWSKGNSWGQTQNEEYITSNLVFQKTATVRIYAYASASNDNQPSIVYFEDTPLVTAVTLGDLTKYKIVEQTVYPNDKITFRVGGYDGVCMAIVELIE